MLWGYLVSNVKMGGLGSSFCDLDLESHLFVGIGIKIGHWN
jgi:hypothetical protein